MRRHLPKSTNQHNWSWQNLDIMLREGKGEAQANFRRRCEICNRRSPFSQANVSLKVHWAILSSETPWQILIYERIWVGLGYLRRRKRAFWCVLCSKVQLNVVWRPSSYQEKLRKANAPAYAFNRQLFATTCLPKARKYYPLDTKQSWRWVSTCDGLSTTQCWRAWYSREYGPDSDQHYFQ
jgi:hypothetical protein